MIKLQPTILGRFDCVEKEDDGYTVTVVLKRKKSPMLDYIFDDFNEMFSDREVFIYIGDRNDYDYFLKRNDMWDPDKFSKKEYVEVTPIPTKSQEKLVAVTNNGSTTKST